MAADCSGLLPCFAGAVAGIGIVSFCWGMLRPLRLTQHLAVDISSEEGMYVAMPIYGYLRRYFLILLLAGGVVLLMSIVALVRERCSGNVVTQVVGILIVFLGAHLATIAAFETSKRRRRPERPPFVARLVENVQKRLYGVAVFLLLAIALIAISQLS